MDRHSENKALLIVSHPGHELRIHHWLERAKPLVLVLTDGSGSSEHSRLSSTTALLASAGATPGPIYGRFADRDIYSALVKKDISLFCGLLYDIVSILAEEEIALVAADALEYYNPSHDLCRYLTGTAIEIVQRQTGRVVQNFDFTLTASPDACPPDSRNRALCLSLDESALQRKLAASRGYPGLAGEIDTALRLHGLDAFRRECLRPVANHLGVCDRPAAQPFYERHGEARVREGFYSEVIRFSNHMQPIAEALWEEALATA
ncbi:MAG TPA: hypothetical protein VK699_08380 [Terriglobales bacterium]|jgi:hypothetical protein|nr:hypothetical protein [Terriglobales bacterium]